MSKELVIGSNRHETKVAILEEDQLVEVYFQRANEYSLAGSIHKGRVTRVLPGMQSAFVDLGLERDTFLYVSDFFEEHEDIDTVSDEKPSRNERSDRRERDRDRDRGPARQALPPTSTPVPEVFEQRTSVPGLEPENEVIESETSTGESGVGSLPGEQRAAEAGAEPRAPEINAGAGATAREGGQDARGGGDNFRGDRRGRRSRRRRSRGRGFPENKYAQPGAEGAPATENAAGAEPEFEGGEDPDAVEPIILPGELLAKYRHLGPSSEANSGTALEPESDIEDAGNGDMVSERGPAFSEESREPEIFTEHVAIQQEIEEEARALELADRVLSHADEYVDEGEEKYAEVRQNQPSSPFVVSDIESEEAFEDGGEPPQAMGPNVNVSLPELSPETSSALTEADEEEQEEGELEAASLETGVLELEVSPVPGVSAEGEEPGPQTASVREQGGRYMHRVSRRMRRRRGGNRGGQQGQGSGATGNAIPDGQGTGSATALQMERREPQGREFSFVEERTQERAERPERVLPSITELLKPGQEIIVQIAKEPLGQKGARITSHIALPGRYVVFMPSVNHLGVSRKVASDEERQRLKRILQTHRVGTVGGFIVRTAGEGVPEEEIAADMDFLYKLWLDIRQKAEKRPAPALLHYDLDIVQRILRDQVTKDYKSIWVDNEDMYENVLSFMQRFQPTLVSRVKMYTRSAPIFDAFGITQELEKALRPKVWLKSGGYIVINQTEALVAIDINTGKYVGKSNRLEDTIVKTNTEAVKEIVRQIRLRDLGGIIVVDFIDMDERKNRQKVMQALEDAMRADKAPYKILQFNDFGLVAITRKRVKQSLERTLCSPCPYCEGAGYVKSVQTVIGEILVEAQKIAKAIEGNNVLLRVHPDIAKVLKANDNRYLEELEQILRRPVLVKGDPALHMEKFDLG